MRPFQVFHKHNIGFWSQEIIDGVNAENFGAFVYSWCKGSCYKVFFNKMAILAPDFYQGDSGAVKLLKYADDSYYWVEFDNLWPISRYIGKRKKIKYIAMDGIVSLANSPPSFLRSKSQ
jgi:hypothetical protein